MSAYEVTCPTLPPKARAKKMMQIVEGVAKSILMRLPRHVEFDELVGVGSVGLAEAYTRRRGMPGPAFEQFARKRIRGAILDELRRKDPVTRSIRTQLKKVVRARAGVERELGREATEQEVAESMGVALADHQRVRAAAAVALKPLADEMELADRTTPSPEDLVMRKQLVDRVRARVALLPPRLRDLFEQKYENDASMREIGPRLGVTEARICQLHGRIIADLVEAVKENAGTEKAEGE